MSYHESHPYFLTAYDIAVKWGFKGTEEDWLNSLTAFAMAKEAGYAGTAEEWLADLIDPVPELQIGDVTTLDGGSMATATITGDRRNPMLNLGIPRGVGMIDALPFVGGTMKGGIDMDSNQIIGLPEPVRDSGAVPKSYADKMLPLDGSREMQGAIKMSGHEITGIPTPTKDDSAVPKSYADKMLPKTGGTMNGNIIMGNSRIKEVGAPLENGDAANKGYVDTKEVSITLLASGWSDRAPYTQTVTVAGLKDTLHAKAYPAWPESLEEKLTLSDEAANIRHATRSGSTMTFECWESKPIMDIPVTVEVYV